MRVRLCCKNPIAVRLIWGDWEQELGHRRVQLLRIELQAEAPVQGGRTQGELNGLAPALPSSFRDWVMARGKVENRGL